MVGDLAVVERWLRAVKDSDAGGLEALSDEQVEIVGPRGHGVLPRHVLGGWLARSGFRSTELRWFCGGDRRVVVEQLGEWHEIGTGELQDRRVIGSEILVRGGVLARYVRHDSGVLAALAAAGLSEQADAVTRRC